MLVLVLKYLLLFCGLVPNFFLFKQRCSAGQLLSPNQHLACSSIPKPRAVPGCGRLPVLRVFLGGHGGVEPLVRGMLGCGCFLVLLTP